jgi:hypothetical protein
MDSLARSAALLARNTHIILVNSLERSIGFAQSGNEEK